MSISPVISVIVCTHNRSSAIRRLLQALSEQQGLPLHQVEVLVIADGCTDETETVLRSYRGPLTLRSFVQLVQGRAAALNRGVAEAQAPLLLFLDEALIPGPAVVAAHLRSHAAGAGLLAVGPQYVAANPGADLLTKERRLRWNDHFHALAQPGHRSTYRDVRTGNCSLSKTDLVRLGEFDPAFQQRLDWELGIRAVAAGLAIRCLPEAAATHAAASDLTALCRRARREGATDVRLARRYPALAAQLPLADPPSRRVAADRLRLLLYTLAYRLPYLGDALAARLHTAVQCAEQLKLRAAWRRWMQALYAYWYWRGVAETLADRAELTAVISAATLRPNPPPRIITLDLQIGLQEAAAVLDRERPDGATIVYGTHAIGSIPAQPGAEPLRGTHLAPYLSRWLGYEVFTAIVRTHTGEAAPDLATLLTTDPQTIIR